jgi:hypothetical protein
MFTEELEGLELELQSITNKVDVLTSELQVKAIIKDEKASELHLTQSEI